MQAVGVSNWTTQARVINYAHLQAVVSAPTVTPISPTLQHDASVLAAVDTALVGALWSLEHLVTFSHSSALRSCRTARPSTALY
jgi:hypothetical protein